MRTVTEEREVRNFLHDAIHDLNNPLQSIYTFLELLRAADLTGETTQLIEGIGRAASQIRTVTLSMRKYARAYEADGECTAPKDGSRDRHR